MNKIFQFGLIAIETGLFFSAECSWSRLHHGNAQFAEIPALVNSPNPGGFNSASVRIKILLPDSDGKAQPDASIQAGTGNGIAAVTFKLLIINIGVATNPTTTLSKSVAVDASGIAATNFDSIPSKTVIGDISINGGKIGSYSRFWGAADLVPGSNTIIVSPKGSKDFSDLVAETIERIASEPALFEIARKKMCALLVKLLRIYRVQSAEESIQLFENPPMLGLGTIQNQIASLQALVWSKTIIISETGWPTAGDPEGAAISGTDTARIFLSEIANWTKPSKIPVFYLEAFDQDWKTTEKNGVGPHWGLFDWSGKLKEGFENVLSDLFH